MSRVDFQAEIEVDLDEFEAEGEDQDQLVLEAESKIEEMLSRAEGLGIRIMTHTPMVAEASLDRLGAGSNPAQQMSKEALDIAKELQNLLNSLAGMSNRQEIAQAAGLQSLPEAIQRLYELADRYRAGGFQELQPANADSWDPDKLRRTAKPLVDDKATPVETVEDPAEEFRFERERTSCPHCQNTQLEK